MSKSKAMNLRIAKQRAAKKARDRELRRRLAEIDCRIAQAQADLNASRAMPFFRVVSN